MVKDILGLPGYWALVRTMDDDTEGTISHRGSTCYGACRDRPATRVATLQSGDPAELWAAYEKRFVFDGSA